MFNAYLIIRSCDLLPNLPDTTRSGVGFCTGALSQLLAALEQLPLDVIFQEFEGEGCHLYRRLWMTLRGLGKNLQALTARLRLVHTGPTVPGQAGSTRRTGP
ncbi:MAG: hypothetical protein NTV68_03125 [Methanomicrobiales archaeon]|nr:hypothetical protein [Methanomicrobiales archaeon]